MKVTLSATRQEGNDACSFNVVLPAVESRSGGAGGNHTIVFTFSNPLSSVGGAAVTSGVGSVFGRAIGDDAHQYVVNLTGVANAQNITVSLTNVTDSFGNFSSVVAASMGVLTGDTTGNGIVNATDVSQTKGQSGQPVSGSNFRTDITVNGSINGTDVSSVKAKSGTGLPP